MQDPKEIPENETNITRVATVEKPDSQQLATLHVRMELSAYDEIKELANYCALEGLITGDYRGNVTAFINWCITIGKETLRMYAEKKRGF